MSTILCPKRLNSANSVYKYISVDIYGHIYIYGHVSNIIYDMCVLHTTAIWQLSYLCPLSA